MREEAQQFVNNIKGLSLEIFSDNIYESLISDQDLQLATLMYDKKMQNENFSRICEAMESLNPASLLEKYHELGLQFNWLEQKINIFQQFNNQIFLIKTDLENGKSNFDQKLKELYDLNEGKININNSYIEFDLFKSHMHGLDFDNQKFRILNVIYNDNIVLSQQSHDEECLRTFYRN